MSEEAFQPNTPVEPQGQPAPVAPQGQAPQVPDVNAGAGDDDDEPVAPQLTDEQRWIQENALKDPDTARRLLDLATEAYRRQQEPPPQQTQQQPADLDTAYQRQMDKIAQDIARCRQVSTKLKLQAGKLEDTNPELARSKLAEAEYYEDGIETLRDKKLQVTQEYQKERRIQAEQIWYSEAFDFAQHFPHATKEDVEMAVGMRFRGMSKGEVQNIFEQIWAGRQPAAQGGYNTGQPTQQNNVIYPTFQQPSQGPPGGGGGQLVEDTKAAQKATRNLFNEWYGERPRKAK